MKTWIALLRGINVGGKNKLPMASLKDEMASLGFEDVRTYIQSGNVVFDAAGEPEALADSIALAINDKHGFEPRIMVLSADEFTEAVKNNPFSVDEDSGNLLHLFFMDAIAQPDLGKIEALALPSEQWAFVDRVFYLYAPEGIGRSKLAGGAEKAIGVPTTARNWRTILKLSEMIAIQ